jgi:hypothetical protein
MQLNAHFVIDVILQNWKTEPSYLQKKPFPIWKRGFAFLKDDLGEIIEND